MTNAEKIAILEDKISKLDGSPKNIKCPGVVRKLKRQLRSLKSQN